MVSKLEGNLFWMERQGMAFLPYCTLLPLCNFKTVTRQKVRMEIYVGKCSDYINVLTPTLIKVVMHFQKV